MAMTGGCLCGAVRFTIAAAPLGVVHCHCAMCRKHSGAAFLTYALFDAKRVTFSGTPPAAYRSSPHARRMHCGTCGSPVSFIYDAEPQHIYITAGSIDQASALKPGAHWYASSRLPWANLHDGLPQWRELPG
jgi:hypothetical protein